MPKKVTPNGDAAPAPPKPRKAAKKKAAAKQSTEAAAPASNRRYARNLHGAAGGVRVLLQNENQIRLAPRGQVGDLTPVSEDDRMDANYIANYGILFEEISQSEAKKIVQKQNTNAQAPRPSTMDQLTNERGESYTQAEPIVEQSFEEQGETVATISDGPGGRFTDGHQGTITRAPGAPPQQQNVPGSAGNPLPNIPSDVPPEQVADWIARNAKDADRSADALRGNLDVKVEPPQKT